MKKNKVGFTKQSLNTFFLGISLALILVFSYSHPLHADPTKVWRDIYGFEEWEIILDHDGDGVFSDREFLFGTNPLDPLSRPVPNITVDEMQNSEVTISWTISPGIEIQLFHSINFVDWVPLTAPILGDGQRMTLIHPLISSHQFYQLRAIGDPIDTDGDCLLDFEEILFFGTDPTLVDSDGDGLTDGDEIKIFQQIQTLNPRPAEVLSEVACIGMKIKIP